MRIPAYLVWPLVFLGQFLAISLLAWHLLAQINFAYPAGYKLLNLETHIAEYAPLNHRIHGFQFTRPPDHWKLFGEITNAIQHDGKGLTEINFVLPNNTKIPLMHSAEIIHLTDVSHLVNVFYNVGYGGALLWIIFFFIAYKQKISFPSSRHIIFGFFGSVFIITSIILMLGPTQAFYWFHTKIFPNGHQWFFYYEDSLMTTLMKAPDIFAFIASLLLIVLILLWVFSTFAMARILKNIRPAPIFANPNSAKMPKPSQRKKNNRKNR